MDFGKLLSDNQVERIHDAAVELLEHVGFKLMDDAALIQCEARGARVDRASGGVRIPRPLLRELIGQAPGEYAVGGSGGASYQVGKGGQWGVAIVTDPWIVDYETGQPRRPCLEDVRRHTIIGQKMDHVAALSRMDYPVTDVAGPSSSLRALEQHLLYHDKHCYYAPVDAEGGGKWADVMEILGRRSALPNEPLFSTMVAVLSPLTISGLNVDLIRLGCDHGSPVIPTVCPMAGSTAPYSLAGTLVQGHAENLALASLTQIMRPGHPFLYGFGPSVTDMRSGHDLYYTLDKVPWKTGAVQLAKACGLPVSAECGGTMTYRYDPQNGAEGILFMLAAVASGADVLAGFGSCYTAMGMSAEMMVIQEAWMHAARFLTDGIKTDDLHLGLDNIRQAGPGGNFMTDDLTLQFMGGGEFFANDLFDLSPCGEESKGMLERAHDKVEELVAGFESPLPGDIQEDLRRYFHDECTRLE